MNAEKTTAAETKTRKTPRLEQDFSQLLTIIQNKEIILFEKEASQRWTNYNKLSDSIKTIIIINEIIKSDIKNGFVTQEKQKIIKKLYDYLRLYDLSKESEICKLFLKENSAAYFQTMAVISEQFFRWGDIKRSLQAVNGNEEVELPGGNEILQAVIDFNQTKRKQTSLSDDISVIKEQIRFCLAYIQACSNNQFDYQKKLTYLKACKKFVDRQNRETNVSWFGTLASIDSYLGRYYRNKLEHRESLRAFGRSLENYEKRLQERETSESNFKFTNKIKNEALLKRNQKERNFIKHRTALILIVGFAWMDISRGQLYKAIFNSLIPAKFLLRDMNDVLAENYLELLQSAAMRWLSQPAYSNIIGNEEALFKVEQSLEKAQAVVNKFRELNVPRFTLRALYEEALCLEYCARWDECENKLKEIVDLSDDSDLYWKIRASFLKARVMARKKVFIASKIKLSEALNIFERLKEHAKKFKTTELEYYLYKGEIYLAWEKYKEAEKCFLIAQKINNFKVSSRDLFEPLNPKIEAYCLLFRTQIAINSGLLSKAEQLFWSWKSSLSEKVNDIYAHDLAAENELKLKQLSERTFSVKIEKMEDLNYEKQVNELRKFLILQANNMTEHEGHLLKDIAAHMGISRQTLNNWREEYNSKSKE